MKADQSKRAPPTTNPAVAARSSRRVERPGPLKRGFHRAGTPCIRTPGSCRMSERVPGTSGDTGRSDLGIAPTWEIPPGRRLVYLWMRESRVDSGELSDEALLAG